MSRLLPATRRCRRQRSTSRRRRRATSGVSLRRLRQRVGRAWWSECRRRLPREASSNRRRLRPRVGSTATCRLLGRAPTRRRLLRRVASLVDLRLRAAPSTRLGRVHPHRLDDSAHRLLRVTSAHRLLRATSAHRLLRATSARRLLRATSARRLLRGTSALLPGTSERLRRLETSEGLRLRVVSVVQSRRLRVESCSRLAQLLRRQPSSGLDPARAWARREACLPRRRLRTSARAGVPE